MWPAKSSSQVLPKSKSMTSLSETVITSSAMHRRASFTSTDSTFAPQSTFGSSGEARIVWGTKESTSTGQHESDEEGFVYELVMRKLSRARLDSLFDTHSDSGEGSWNLGIYGETGVGWNEYD
jgi:hypothetical protein